MNKIIALFFVLCLSSNVFTAKRWWNNGVITLADKGETITLARIPSEPNWFKVHMVCKSTDNSCHFLAVGFNSTGKMSEAAVVIANGTSPSQGTNGPTQWVKLYKTSGRGMAEDNTVATIRNVVSSKADGNSITSSFEISFAGKTNAFITNKTMPKFLIAAKGNSTSAKPSGHTTKNRWGKEIGWLAAGVQKVSVVAVVVAGVFFFSN